MLVFGAPANKDWIVLLKYVLDEERLNGSIPVSVTTRPSRFAEAVRDTDLENFRELVSLNSQVWAGVSSPIIPVDEAGYVHALYTEILPGEDIDGVPGMDRISIERGELKVESVSSSASFGSVFAPSTLRVKAKDYYLPLAIVDLADSDPWRDIYAICLGYIPDTIRPDLLKQSNLLEHVTADTFLEVKRDFVEGSASDLVRRLKDSNSITPREINLHRLAHGQKYRASFRDWDSDVPNPATIAEEAGPNIVVVCSHDDIGDLALLWNLRAAHSQSKVMPIGIPKDCVDHATLQSLLDPDAMWVNGIYQTRIFVTSTSISVSELSSRIPSESFQAVSPRSLLTFGPAPGKHSTQIAYWDNGLADIHPFEEAFEAEIADLLPHKYVPWQLDVSIDSQRFPRSGTLRKSSLNQEFFAGKCTITSSLRTREPVKVEWPSRMLTLKSVASSNSYRIQPSEPGKAALVLLESLENIWELDMLAHQPLIDLLQSMSERKGVNWAKRRAREQGAVYEASPQDVAPTADELIEQPIHKFQKAFGNNAKATGGWLNWAEDRRLIIKGFPISCPVCDAKDWAPVMSFAPPVFCSGCAREIRRPFPQGQVNFKYRLGESMRRLFAQDALGHLLALRYFVYLMSSGGMIGLHPGLDVMFEEKGRIAGEVDLLMLLANGDSVPIEVKKSFSGVHEEEVRKLDELSSILRAPWSAFAVMEYANKAPQEFSRNERRGKDLEHNRILLTYDQLLDPTPIHALGIDPFTWAPLTAEDIASREKSFSDTLVGRLDNSVASMLEYSLLREP